jgi:YfiH family protein
MSALESALLRGAGFRHGFSVKPLDFSLPSQSANDEAIALLLRLPPRRMYRVSQVHGARAVIAPLIGVEEADALVAFEPETAVGVRTADCVPILLANTQTGAVAAVHAGWRGVVAHVLRSAFEIARKPARSELPFDVAAIGPCIGACCFDVGSDVAAQLAPHVKEGKGDLRAAVRAQLVAHGLDASRIEDIAGCTKCDADRFFSHRRDGELAGRHLAVIATRHG